MRKFVVLALGTAFAALLGTSAMANISAVPMLITGGGNPSVPAAAAAAGFTTLALNMDFTGATKSSYNGTTFNINDVSGDSTAWLYCYNGASTNPTNPIWWLPPSWNNAAPCSDVSIINDGGTNSLDIKWTPTDGSNGINATEIATWTVNEASNTGHSFPVAGYAEIKFRSDSTTLSSCPSGQQCIYNDFWEWPNSGYSTEWDFVELAFGGGGIPFAYSAPHGDANAQTFPQWGDSNSMDFTTYHTYGWRFTTNGSVVSVCGFLDNSLVGCNSDGSTSTAWTPASGSSTTDQLSFLRATVGPQGTTNVPTVNNNMYIKYIRYWSCSSWATGPCHGTVLTN